MASEFFGRQRECRFYTAGCGNKMAVSVTGPRAVNELGGPVIPGSVSTHFIPNNNFFQKKNKKSPYATPAFLV